MKEHDYEPVRGLPGRLPQGEVVLWQGAPDLPTLARHNLHLPLIGLYCAGIAVFTASTADSLRAAVLSFGEAGGLCLFACGLILGYGWLVSRSSVYTITNRRVVMRVGVALSMSINLPFAQLEAAGLHCRRDGSGDIALTVAKPAKVAWLALWPHARPWRLAHPQPLLLGLPHAEAVARTLGRAMAAAADMAVPAFSGTASDAPETGRRAAAAA